MAMLKTVLIFCAMSIITLYEVDGGNNEYYTNNQKLDGASKYFLNEPRLNMEIMECFASIANHTSIFLFPKTLVNDDSSVFGKLEDIKSNEDTLKTKMLGCIPETLVQERLKNGRFLI